MYKGPERREHKRINKKFMVSFQMLPGENEHFFNNGWDMVAAENLAAGGILIKYDRNIELDSLLNFKIAFPASETPITCKGRVVRVEKITGTILSKIAAVFEDIKEKEKNIINRAADEFFSHRPGMIAS